MRPEPRALGGFPKHSAASVEVGEEVATAVHHPHYWDSYHAVVKHALFAVLLVDLSRVWLVAGGCSKLALLAGQRAGGR